MNILVLTNFYPPYYLGGYEMRCRDVVDGLIQRYHRIIVLSSRLTHSQGEIDGHVYRLLHFVRGYHTLSQKSLSRGKVKMRYYQLKFALVSRINYTITRLVLHEMQPDLVYAWNMYDISVGPLVAAHDQSIPLVFNLGDYWLSELKEKMSLTQSRFKRWYRASVLGLPDFDQLDTSHILCVSQALKQMYINKGFPEQHITVIPRGIDTYRIPAADDFSPPAASSQRHTTRLVFVGRIVREKGTHTAIEAIKHMTADMGMRNVTLDIIGNGETGYINELKALVNSTGLQEHVVFLGRLNQDALLERYTEYDAMLFTSLWVEPFPVTILEAMTRGLPVVATRVGGAPEIITDGETGLLVPPGDSVALAHAVQRLAHDQELAETIRRKALQTIHERYTLDHIIDQHETYLQQVIQQTRSGSHVRCDEKIS